MDTLQFMGLLITAAALFGWVSSRWLRLPTTIGTMLLTATGSVALLWLSRYVPSLHVWAVSLSGRIDFERLILHGMLALLLFAGSFLLDLEFLGREKLTVGILSVFGTLFSTIGVALLMWSMLPFIGIHAGFMECLFFGALIAPTDPIAVLEMLRRVGVPKNVQAQLAGESLFNDGIGAVLFLTLLEASRGAIPSVGHVGGLLLLKAGGGLALGVFAAWLTSLLMRMVDAYQVEILLTIALAIAGYATADSLNISAPLEAVAAGIALRRINLAHPRGAIAHESVDRFWEVVDEVQNSVLFVLLGLELLAIPFQLVTLQAGAAAILSVNLVRLAVVSLLLLAIRLLQPGHASSLLALAWGGLRGGLSLALALAVPAGQGRNWIVPTTYMVVLFSIVVQGGSLDLFLKKLRIYQQGPAI